MWSILQLFLKKKKKKGEPWSTYSEANKWKKTSHYYKQREVIKFAENESVLVSLSAAYSFI